MSYEIRICSVCAVEKSINDFYKRSDSKDAIRKDCKDCCRNRRDFERQKIIDRARYLENPEKEKARHVKWVEDNPEKLFAYQLKTKYNITFEQFHEMLLSQGGRCASCNEPTKNLYIDHDHLCCSGERCCGKCIRGLLCQHCNTGLGYAKDSIKILKGMIEYLERYGENK